MKVKPEKHFSITLRQTRVSVKNLTALKLWKLYEFSHRKRSMSRICSRMADKQEQMYPESHRQSDLKAQQLFIAGNAFFVCVPEEQQRTGHFRNAKQSLLVDESQ